MEGWKIRNELRALEAWVRTAGSCLRPVKGPGLRRLTWERRPLKVIIKELNGFGYGHKERSWLFIYLFAFYFQTDTKGICN